MNDRNTKQGDGTVKMETLSVEVLEVINGLEAEYSVKTQYAIAVTLLARIIATVAETQTGGLLSGARQKVKHLFEDTLPALSAHVVEAAVETMFPQEDCEN